MKYTQNDRITQLTETTLIVGVDIASQVHYARAFDFRGIEHGKVVRFANDLEGFEQLKMWVKGLCVKHGKDHVMIGMEPTGHYWFSIAEYAKRHDMEAVLVNPYHVKRCKELDDNNPTKNDHKDPKTIAMLVKDGRYVTLYIPDGVHGELRTAMATRWRIMKQLNGVKNRVRRWLAIYFPEFDSVFLSWEGKAAQACLQKFPTPSLVLEQGIEGITQHWKEVGLKAVGVKRATKLYEAAKRSVGISQGLRAAREELSLLLEEYSLLKHQEQRIMALVEELLSKIPACRELLKIKGIGLVTAAGFLSEVGDITRFDSPKQIQKYAGLNLKENSSGKHKGRTTISKRGRSGLRALLFRAVMPLVAKNDEFRELHRHYTTRPENPLTKKQSLVALMCKLIRVFYAILTKNVTYDGQKMLCDVQRPVLQLVA
jgi:transposase